MTRDADSLGVPQNTVGNGNGSRSSSATAYLEPALNRPNLDVLIHTTVTRLISTSKSNQKPTFKKVEFAANSTGQQPRSLPSDETEIDNK